jgi:hypothetical protein
MTEPDADTQPQPTVPSPSGPTEPQPNVLSGAAQPSATQPSAAQPGATQPPATMHAVPPPATPSDWREPPWAPPRDRRRGRPSPAALVFGGAILLIGIWLFLEHTVGLDLPDIQWGNLWPIVLIVIGGAIVLRALDRR